MHPRSIAALGLLALAGTAPTQAALNEWTEGGPDAGWTFQVAFHPTNSQIALLSTVRGIYRTTDGSAHWTLVNEAATGRDLAFDPSNPNRVVHASEKVWISVDAGQSFAVAQSPGDYVRQVEISAGGTIYVTTQFPDKVFKSTDHGNTWTPCAAPWPQAATVGALTVDPNANGGVDHLFLRATDSSTSTVTSATWRSVDGCTSWVMAGAGDPASPPNSASDYAVMPGNPSRVLAASYNGIYRSTNGGDTWTQVQNGSVDQVEFDPKVPGGVSAIAVFGRLMRSTDNGDTWDPFHGAAVQTPGEPRLHSIPRLPGGSSSPRRTVRISARTAASTTTCASPACVRPISAISPRPTMAPCSLSSIRARAAFFDATRSRCSGARWTTTHSSRPRRPTASR